VGVEVKFHLSSKLTGINEEVQKIELEKDISLRQLLFVLGEKYPVFAQNFLPSLDLQSMKLPLLILINSKSSNLQHTVKPEDRIDIFLIGAGG
jgi:hypothetical protein